MCIYCGFIERYSERIENLMRTRLYRGLMISLLPRPLPPSLLIIIIIIYSCRCTPVVEPQSAKFFCTQLCQRFCQSSEPCSNSLVYLLLFKWWCERSWGGWGGGVGEDLSLTVYFFTAGPTQIYTSQPFSLHCNKKFIHAAGDHHGSRQNIRPVRTNTKEWQGNKNQSIIVSRFRS